MAESIAGRERQFDGAIFLVFARSLFLLFLQSRSKRDLLPMRPHLLPELYQAWQKLQAARPERRRARRVVNYDVQNAELSEHYQIKGVEVAVVVLHGLATPQDSRRDTAPRALREQWVFTRPVALDGQPCPSCGLPWTLSAWGKCRYCNRDFSGITDGWTVVNVKNLIVSQALFQEESAFLDQMGASARKSQVTHDKL